MFFFVYAVWAQGVNKLAAQAREQEVRDKKTNRRDLNPRERSKVNHAFI